MGSGVGLRQVGYVDCAGGGQVIVQNGIAYVAHMRMPPGTHSHKVRVHDGVMVVNHELNHADPNPVPADFAPGFGVYDVSDAKKPRELTRWKTVGSGVHRFDFDGRYAYLS